MDGLGWWKPGIEMYIISRDFCLLSRLKRLRYCFRSFFSWKVLSDGTLWNVCQGKCAHSSAFPRVLMKEVHYWSVEKRFHRPPFNHGIIIDKGIYVLVRCRGVDTLVVDAGWKARGKAHPVNAGHFHKTICSIFTKNRKVLEKHQAHIHWPVWKYQQEEVLENGYNRESLFLVCIGSF